MKRYFVALSIFFFLATGTLVYAQATTVYLTVTPENAEVGDIVTIKASSYNQDLTRSTFTWTANGKIVKRGVGVSSISFRKTVNIPLITVGVSINLPSGDTIDQSVDITNQSVDLIWEAVDAYTPPFYKGKALPISESSVRFNPVLARGNLFGSSSAKNNIYTWSRNNEVIGSASGTGKDSFPLVMDYLLDKEQIGIRVENIGSGSITLTNLDLKPVDSQMLFYTKNLSGFTNWNNAVSDGYTPTIAVQLVATPYFITPKNLRDVKFSWKSDGEEIGNNQNLTVGPGSDGSGAFTVAAENTKTFFQTVEKTLLVKF